MHLTSAPRVEAATAAPTAPTAPGAPSRRVVDAPTRAFHWLLALGFAGAYASADGERWRLVHVTLGYTMAGLLAFRVLWGLLGPRQARLALWVARLRAAPGLLRALRQHGPLLAPMQTLLHAVAVMALASLVILSTASGYATDRELAGEWLEEVHEACGEGLLAVVLGHIGLVLAGALLRGPQNLLSMLTGRLPGRGPDLAKRNHGFVAALLLGAVLAFWGWQWRESAENGSAAAVSRDGRAARSAEAGHRPGHDKDDD